MISIEAEELFKFSLSNHLLSVISCICFVFSDTTQSLLNLVVRNFFGDAKQSLLNLLVRNFFVRVLNFLFIKIVI